LNIIVPVEKCRITELNQSVKGMGGREICWQSHMDV